MKYTSIAVLTTVIVLASPAHAQQLEERQALATELVALIDYSERDV